MKGMFSILERHTHTPLYLQAILFRQNTTNSY